MIGQPGLAIGCTDFRLFGTIETRRLPALAAGRTRAVARIQVED